MKATVIIEKSIDGSYDARMNNTALDFFLLGQGSTVKEAIEDFHMTHQEVKALYKEDKRPFPELDFEYIYDLPSFLESYAKIFSFASLERLTGVNQSQLSQYVQGYRKPSRKTAKKIEKKLHDFAKELNQVQFV